MSDQRKYEVNVATAGNEVVSYLDAVDLRQAVEKAFKLIPRDWPGRPSTFRSVVIQEVRTAVDA